MKINKKGFTLVELLVVIAIMALILIMVFPAVNQLLKRNKIKEYTYHEKAVVESAKLYVDKNEVDLAGEKWEGCLEITYQDLIDSTLLKKFSKEDVSCNGKVQVTKENKKTIYTPNITCTKDSEEVYKSNTTLKNSCTSQTITWTKNNNILAVYAYDQTNTNTLCITGEESTCQKINPVTFEKGTIVKYQVNDSESYYFYVLHNDGNTLTMQQREDTTTSGWYSSEDNTKGPITALTALEEETSDWDNVLDQTYTMGTTVFGNKSNAFTGCDAYNSCTTNKYTLASRTGKARMITVQEAAEVGCQGSQKTCPIWMYNYLNDSINYGGTVNGPNRYYWTMSASSSNTTNAYHVHTYGALYTYGTQNTNNGLRAVIVVEKYLF